MWFERDGADTILTSALRGKLEDQLYFLDRLASGADAADRSSRGGPDLVLCFALLGRFPLERGRKDFAAMLFHRALERRFDRLAFIKAPF
jgi:hypothetical protein